VQLLKIAKEVKEKGYIEKKGNDELLDISLIFESIKEKLKHYIWFSNEKWYDIITAYILGTYMHVVFQCYPILFVRGMRGVGKSTLLTFLSKTCFNATRPQVRYSEADLKRTIHHSRCTFILDEQQYLSNSREYAEILAVLEGGTERGQTTSIIDREKEKRYVYEIYSPKIIASRVDALFEDKAIIIQMEEPPQEKQGEYAKRRATLGDDKEFEEIVRDCISFAFKYYKGIVKAYKEVEPTEVLTSRAFQYWRPILAILKFIYDTLDNSEKFEEIVKFAERLTTSVKGMSMERELEILILRIILRDNMDKFTLRELLEKIQEERPEIKNWQTILAPLNNLGIVKKKDTRKSPIVYHVDLERAKDRARKRGIEVEDETDQNTPFGEINCLAQDSVTYEGEKMVIVNPND